MYDSFCLVDRRKILVAENMELQYCNHGFISEPLVLVIVQEEVMERKILAERRNETG
jgi:hypothetical protein